VKLGNRYSLVNEVDNVRLDVIDGEELIQCRVSQEALAEMARQYQLETNGNALNIAQECFDCLTWLWMKKIRLGTREEDGSILLRSRDIIC